MEKSLTKQTMRGALWLGGVKASNAALQFGILAILARLLSPTEFGLMGLALIVVSFSDIFTDLGFGPAITQKKELSKADIHTGFTFSIIFGILLLIGLWILSPLISAFFRNKELIPILRAISIVLLLRSIITTPLGLMYRHMQYKLLSIIQIVSYAIGYGTVGVILACSGFGVWSLVIAVISQTALSLLLYLCYSKKAFGISFNSQSFKSLLTFGGGYSLSKVFSYAANKGDKIIIGRMLNVDALGFYERGYQIVRYVSGLLGEIIDKVLFSPIAKKQDNRELVGKVFLELTYIMAIVFFPLSIFIYNNAEPIVHVLLGEQWGSTAIIIQIMSGSVFFLICSRIGSTVAKSLGDVYRRAFRTFFYAMFILLASFFSVRWGIEGVAIAVTLVVVVNYFLAFTQVHALTNVSYNLFFRSHGLGILLMILYQLIYLLLDKYILAGFSNVMQLSMGVALLIFVYSAGVILDNKKVFSKYYKLIRNKGV